MDAASLELSTLVNARFKSEQDDRPGHSRVSVFATPEEDKISETESHSRDEEKGWKDGRRSKLGKGCDGVEDSG